MSGLYFARSAIWQYDDLHVSLICTPLCHDIKYCLAAVDGRYCNLLNALSTI